MKILSARRKKRHSLFDIFNVLFMTLLSLIFLYPLLMTLGLSFSSAKELVGKSVILFPVGFSTQSYVAFLTDTAIFRYYVNTIVYAISGTFVSLLFTSLLAYPLTISEFIGKKLITILLLITMFFGGGLIPSYLNIRNLHMLNTIWAMILPGCISAWNTIMFVNFFHSIPDSLRESATIDGANHFRVLFSIILPLSKALLATIALFTIVGFWNDYFNALIYLDSTSKMPIQIFLRKILVNMEIAEGNANQGDEMMRLLDMVNANPRTVKAAATIITIIPVLCVYPFLQKYFTKGMMIGAVKA
ncbi:carbohydrate ABC transporter permease [Bianquea renquensis]|uniref:Carbohydrate ABC transporter permease n=1 Tax=Bianquea renquensis TaxID=2763661 RepID=A0A926DU51_9FIRM|nr:carbohydrate ABC transporter permease [Bianquea renquensis]MBC8544121.1 carbohydrate ABC transporter permease [Bianquea renquensis]